MNEKYIIVGLLVFLITFFCSSQSASNTDILKDKSSWFSESLEFKGIALQDDDWHIWGCSPILDHEGKIHLFVARWPEKTGHEGWYTHSQVAHFVTSNYIYTVFRK